MKLAIFSSSLYLILIFTLKLRILINGGFSVHPKKNSLPEHRMVFKHPSPEALCFRGWGKQDVVLGKHPPCNYDVSFCTLFSGHSHFHTLKVRQGKLSNSLTWQNGRRWNNLSAVGYCRHVLLLLGWWTNPPWPGCTSWSGDWTTYNGCGFRVAAGTAMDWLIEGRIKNDIIVSRKCITSRDIIVR